MADILKTEYSDEFDRLRNKPDSNHEHYNRRRHAKQLPSQQPLLDKRISRMVQMFTSPNAISIYTG